MNIIKRTEELIRLFDNYFNYLQDIFTFLKNNRENIILKNDKGHVITNFIQTIELILPFQNRINPHIDKLKNDIEVLNKQDPKYNKLSGLTSSFLVSQELLELLPYLGWLSQENIAIPLLKAKLVNQKNATLNTFQTLIANQMQTLTRLPLLINEIKNDYKKNTLIAAENVLHNCHRLIAGTVSYINTRNKRVDKFIFSHIFDDYKNTLEHYCEKVILHSTKIYNHNYYNKARTSVYTNWLKNSNTSIFKCGFLNSPKRSHTRKIEKLIKDYNGFYKVDTSELKLEHSEKLLKEVNNWLEQQDNALFPCYSDRYFAMKDLQFDIEMEILKLKDNDKIKEEDKFYKKINHCLQHWYDLVKNLVEENKTNSTGIWQMHNVFCHVLKNQQAQETNENSVSNMSLEVKIIVLKAIKSIAYNRLHNDLPQIYYRSALFGKGRAKDVEMLYQEINSYNLYKELTQNNVLIEEENQHSQKPSNIAVERLTQVIKKPVKNP